MLLKIVIVISALVIAFTLNKAKKLSTLMQFQFVGLVILFNPIVPIYLQEKSLWIIADIYALILFFYSSLSIMTLSNEVTAKRTDQNEEHYIKSDTRPKTKDKLLSFHEQVILMATKFSKYTLNHNLECTPESLKVYCKFQKPFLYSDLYSNNHLTDTAIDYILEQTRQLVLSHQENKEDSFHKSDKVPYKKTSNQTVTFPDDDIPF